MSITSSSAPLRLAMLGMIPGNGHPYSWSAIINGFDPKAMASCPYPVIPVYLGKQPSGSVRIPEASVTHLWVDNPAEAQSVASASLIPHILAKPEDAIGKIDGAVISVDDGFDHVRRARPFVEAGIPVFIDKPLATSVEDLRTFIEWEQKGAKILSSAGLRYAPELDSIPELLAAAGPLRWINGITAKTWERYGIHLVEPIFRLLGTGFRSVRLESAPGLEVAHLIHHSGVQVTIPVIYDGGATFGNLQICGTGGMVSVKFSDTYTAFRRQMMSYVEFLRTGVAPYSFRETVELMAVLIAGLRSRAENSRRVEVSEIYSALNL